MGIADRYMEYSERSSRRRRFTLGAQGNALMALVALNIIFFLFILTANLFFIYSHQGQGMEVLDFSTVQWFAVPGELSALAHKPWTILTFMFAHGGTPDMLLRLLLGMLSSMLWLWLFGFILQDISGNRFVFPVYIYGGLLGAVFFIGACNLLPFLRQYNNGALMLAGSTASTVAIATAVIMLDHNYRIFRNIGSGLPIWAVAAIYIVINLLNIGSGSPDAFAVLGGALAGFLFVYFLRRGHDLSTWMINGWNKFIHVFDPSPRKIKMPVRETIFYNHGNREPFVKTSIITQKRVDDILDKISQMGYAALTDEEKKILKKAAEDESL